MGNDRQSKCRYITFFMGNKPDEKYCVVDGWELGVAKSVTPEDCEKYEKYKSCYIEYPIEVSKVNSELPKYWENDDCGKLFWVRPFGDEYEKKAYIGFLLGEFPFTNIVSYTEESKELYVSAYCDIAFFVPELKKIVFGKDAWWEIIDEPSVNTQNEECGLRLEIPENLKNKKIKREAYMEFQYTDKTKQMFEDIKKSIPEFPDILDICVDTTCQSMVKLISKKYDDFVREELEKLGYTIEELKSGRHKLYRTIKPIGDKKEIHNYFVDGECILGFLYDFDISDGIFIRFTPIPYENF